MVPGLNSNVERNGAVFHVQTEDLGRDKPIIQTLVFYGGEVITVLEYSYEALATAETYSPEQVRRRLNHQHHRLLREIAAGVFDVIDTGAGAPTFDDQFRGRQRVLEYLESALTYDRQPCRPLEPVAEEEATTPESSQATEPTVTEPSTVPAEPTPCPQAIPLAATGGTRRRLVIRRNQNPSGDAEEPGRGDESPDAEPRRIRVRQHEERPRAVPVRQRIAVQGVDGESRVDEVIQRLDRAVDRAVPAARPPRRVRWLALSVALVLLAVVAAGWLWFSRQPAVAPVAEVSAPARPLLRGDTSTKKTEAETPQRQQQQPEPPPPEVASSRIVAADRHGLPPQIAEPAEGAAPEVATAEPTAGTIAGAEAADPHRGNEEFAKITPTVVPITTAPSVEELDPSRKPDARPVPPPGEPEEPAPQIRPGMLVELASVDAVPQPTAREFPEYPKRARKKGRQGPVVLRLLIDERGNVADVRLAEGVAESDLSDAAVDAVRRWKYTPARKGRHAVRVWKPVTLHFLLEGRNSSRVRVEE